MDCPAITVVVPTTAEHSKREMMLRAIDSIVSQDGVTASALIVVNGARFDPRLVEELALLPSVRIERIGEPSMPAAMLAGRRSIATPYFGFLDDDDELLPHALRRRYEALEREPDAGFLISNGLIHIDGSEAPLVDDPAPIRRDPLAALVESNWICTSASGLYRTDRVDESVFVTMPKYLEWTYLGAYLLPRMSFVFLEEPSYRKFELANSLSRSHACMVGRVDAIERILGLALDPPILRSMRRRLGDVHHSVANSFMQRGELAKAWSHHLRSLVEPGGLRYVSFSLRLALSLVAPHLRQ
jgi:hypothetical protein